MSSNWLLGWSKRKKIELDSFWIDADLLDFPVNITLASGTGINNADVTDIFDVLYDVTTSGSYINRKKIMLTTDDEQTPCYVEIESWEHINEKACLWTKIPVVVSGTDTTLYLYYDKDQPNNDYYIGDTGDVVAQNVWDSSFQLVMHMAQNPNGDVADAIKDSTSNANHGTPGGGMTSDDLVDGKIGKAMDFDGSDDEIDLGQNTFISNQGTIHAIVKFDDLDSTQTFFASSDISSHEDYLKFEFLTDGKLSIEHRVDMQQDRFGTNNSFNFGVTHNVVLVSNGSAYLIYVDGVFKDSTVIWGSDNGHWFGDLDFGTFDNWIGRWERTTSSRSFDGIIDEVRVSSVARAAEWIKATYHSNWNNLVTFGATEYEPQYFYHGYVKEYGVSVNRLVRLYRRSDGVLMDSTISRSSDGYYYLVTTTSGLHFTVAFDDDIGDKFDALILDKLSPRGIV